MHGAHRSYPVGNSRCIVCSFPSKPEDRLGSVSVSKDGAQMEVDLKIRGPRIADGSGGPLYLGDIAIRDGRIVEIGHVSAKAERVLDADGALVTPGFIDPHTHYDGQATWDAELISSS